MRSASQSGEELRLDDVDRALIAALRANARSSYAELSRVVGLSGPAVQGRVQRLEAAGVITGYHAEVRHAAVGLGVTALVGILQTDRVEQADVAEQLRAVDEIEDCWLVAGEEAFLVKVRVPDVDALEHTLAVLRRVPGVARTRTTVVLSTKWEGRIVVHPVAGAGDR
ncbi:MAG: Lrp/AsnC family transcriptional regulator [Mycobacteriales bacterium]|nr:Lrp/AsnC family transcriptional regulator [Frankia sp.]